MIFYTYLWLRDDGTPYYVGKGSGRRVRKLHKRHCPPKNSELVITQDFESEADALFAEKFLIACYGRKDTSTGILRNLTDGGEGLSGHIFSTEHRAKLGAAQKTCKNFLGHKHSLETLAKMRIASTNPSVETRVKMSVAKLGNKYRRGTVLSLKTRAKISAALLGRKATVEHRAKMSVALKGKPWSTARRAAQDARHTGDKK